LFLIKTYSHGVFSKHLSTTEQSLKLCMKPKGALNLSRLKCCTKFAMLAGGSGITPILSVLNHLLERRENRV
jgi:ferredoxin-NADP reductase